MTLNYTKYGHLTPGAAPRLGGRVLGGLLGLALAAGAAPVDAGASSPGRGAEGPVAMNAPQLVRPGGVGYSLKGPGRSLAQRDVIDTVSANPDLGTFVSALQIAGLTDLLRTVDHVLIFAPTDRAFERMDSDERRALFSDRSALMRLLARHVRFDGTGEGPPGRGTPVGLYRGSAVNVVALDQSARNGVVHIIDDLIRVN